MGIIKQQFYGSQVNALAALFKALGHPCRVLLIKILSVEGHKTNGELVERVGGLAQSTVSQHLSILQELHIIGSTPHENTVLYFLRQDLWNQHKELIRIYLDGGDRDIQE